MPRGLVVSFRIPAVGPSRHPARQPSSGQEPIDAQRESLDGDDEPDDLALDDWDDIAEPDDITEPDGAGEPADDGLPWEDWDPLDDEPAEPAPGDFWPDEPDGDD